MHRGTGCLVNISWQTLTPSATVPALLTIFTVTYEIISAVLTLVRSLQALNGEGPWRWRAQQMSLTFLVLREGSHHRLLNSLRFLMPNCSPAGLIYFGWDFESWPQSSRIILTARTQIHHFTEDNISYFPICKILLRLLDMNLLNEYHKQRGVVSLPSCPTLAVLVSWTPRDTFQPGTFFPRLMTAYTLP